MVSSTLMLKLMGIYLSSFFMPEEALPVPESVKSGRLDVDPIGAAKDRIVQSISDAFIYTKIESRLLTDAETPAIRINVDVFRDEVTLRGEVNSSTAKYEAEHIAATTGGVRAVHNLLKIAA